MKSLPRFYVNSFLRAMRPGVYADYHRVMDRTLSRRAGVMAGFGSGEWARAAAERYAAELNARAEAAAS